MKRILSIFLVAVLTLTLFTSCHGAKETASFVIPAEFDTEKE